MCNSPPRPRCADHTRRDLARINLTGTPSEKAAAQIEYDKTPTGTKELLARAKGLKESGKSDAAKALEATADQYKQERKNLLETFKAERCAIAADPNTATPALSEMVESDEEPTGARHLAVKALFIRNNPVVSGMTFEDALGMFNIPKHVRGVRK